MMGPGLDDLENEALSWALPMDAVDPRFRIAWLINPLEGRNLNLGEPPTLAQAHPMRRDGRIDRGELLTVANHWDCLGVPSRRVVVVFEDPRDEHLPGQYRLVAIQYPRPG